MRNKVYQLSFMISRVEIAFEMSKLMYVRLLLHPNFVHFCYYLFAILFLGSDKNDITPTRLSGPRST